MQLKSLFVLCTIIFKVQGLIDDVHDNKPVPVSQPDDIVQEPETPNDVKFTEINFDEGKNNRLGVHNIVDEDNEPTPANAKSPIAPYQASTVKNDNEGEEKQPWDSFIMSVSMIIVSEIGDKTFLIAALMAMRYSRVVVFVAAWSSLVIMTILSGVVGHALPSLLSKRITQFLASILFVVFGYKLLREGLEMSKDVGVDEELAEVEEEIKASDLNHQMENMESGPSTSFNNTKPWYITLGEQIKDLASFVLSPIFIQVFIMTFLGEWGDRSQIATIALAAGSDYWYVIIGAIVGHGLCTFAACIGGKLLAKKISMRNVTLGGAFSFLIFAILYFYEAYYDIE